MKVTVEPRKLLRLLEFALIGTTKPLLSFAVGEFRKNELRVRGFAERGYIAYHGLFDSKWFLNYEAEKENVSFTKNLLDIINEQFKDTAEIELSTDGDKLWIRNENEEYHEPLLEESPKKFPLQMKKLKEAGLIPKYFEPLVQAYIKKSELTELPRGSYLYTFQADRERLKGIAVFGVDHRFVKTLNIISHPKVKLDKVEISLNAEYFRHCLTGLHEEMWLLIDKDAVIFTEKGKHHNLTYMVRASEI